MILDFGFWILDFGLGLRSRVLRVNRQLCPNRRTGDTSFPFEEFPPRRAPIQNPKSKIQNPPRRSAADGL